VLAGDDPAELTAEVRLAMAEAVAKFANVHPSSVRISIVAASLLAVFDLTGISTEAASIALADRLTSQLDTTEKATALLAVANVTVIALPTVRPVAATVEAPNAPPLASPPDLPPLGSGSDTTVIAAAAASAVVVPMLILGFLYHRHQRKRSAKDLSAHMTVHTARAPAQLHTHDELASTAVRDKKDGLQLSHI